MGSVWCSGLRYGVPGWRAPRALGAHGSVCTCLPACMHVAPPQLVAAGAHACRAARSACAAGRCGRTRAWQWQRAWCWTARACGCTLTCLPRCLPAKRAVGRPQPQPPRRPAGRASPCCPRCRQVRALQCGVRHSDAAVWACGVPGTHSRGVRRTPTGAGLPFRVCVRGRGGWGARALSLHGGSRCSLRGPQRCSAGCTGA